MSEDGERRGQGLLNLLGSHFLDGTEPKVHDTCQSLIRLNVEVIQARLICMGTWEHGNCQPE